MSQPTNAPDSFDRVRELAFVQAVIARHPAAVADFTERLLCVPRMLGALNARRGHALRGDDLADLAHDTIVITMRKLGEFEAFASLECWLHRLCNLELLNAIRRKARTQMRTLPLDDMSGSAADAHPSGHAHDDVHLALERLGGVEAEAIRLHHFEDLTFRGIGNRLGLPTNTVKTRYYRGMTRLEAILRKYQRREQRA